VDDHLTLLLAAPTAAAAAAPDADTATVHTASIVEKTAPGDSIVTH
jgi:hypothetical protein